MPDFQNGKIYKLWSNEGDDIYIGSTTQTLAHRYSTHKNLWSRCCSKNLFEKYSNVKIDIIEHFPCNTKDELCKREGELIRSLNCVNKNIPGRTHKEYCNENKEKIAEYHIEYRENNKEKLADYQTEYRGNNKKKLAEYQQAYRGNNKEKCRAYQQAYIENNKEKCKSYHKAYYIKNKEKILNKMKLAKDLTFI